MINYLLKEMLHISKLVTQSNFNTKIKVIKKKISYYHQFITTAEFNKCCGEILDQKLKQIKLVIEADIKDIYG